MSLFIAAVTDPSEYVQRAAIHALGRLYRDHCEDAHMQSNVDAEALLSSMRSQLHSVNKRVRTTAARSLHAINRGDKVMLAHIILMAEVPHSAYFAQLSETILKHSPTDHSYIYNLTAK